MARKGEAGTRVSVAPLEENDNKMLVVDLVSDLMAMQFARDSWMNDSIERVIDLY